ncbi:MULTISPECIES: hypothetical protein [Myxococcus]|uniref:hypothetical protein n=1 Tax=Myxococcus TaxID=32 RepID=UPI0002E824DB|nr:MULTISPECIES: hypothetical protein [Myxococcus]QZZ51657.1 hypothetical protein MyxoNM_20860 [Myxococcus xanthus]UYI11402.1 hypothetical protein N3T43_20195 [Myxococcus xanthus]UYI18772.1 hypothetical protein N1129_20650 [Myxococcus xanthus]SDW69608.1 hypothetical protein SAMN05444383_103167 [Myxococcus xanthus]
MPTSVTCPACGLHNPVSTPNREHVLSATPLRNDDVRDLSIWGYALGYFVAYAPYSALTKALSGGALPGMREGISGFTLLPVSTSASLVGMFVFLTWMRWWRYAGHRQVWGFQVPAPGRWTLLSGLCSAAIIGTTTLAYTLPGASIVFMMLLMRGGVLVLAPLVDVLSGRRVRWPSWVALGLSFSAVAVAAGSSVSPTLTLLATVDVGVYLAAYFFRLRAMSQLAKSGEREVSIRYFVEEQMVATPVLVGTLAVLALIGGDGVLGDIRDGFTGALSRGHLASELAVGLLSQATGIFGGLILLDGRENAFCVPVNRASSVLAGVVATVVMSVTLGQPGAGALELVGAALVVAAMAVLAVPTVLAARRKAGEPAAPPVAPSPGP